jgi:hypothetical protein
MIDDSFFYKSLVYGRLEAHPKSKRAVCGCDGWVYQTADFMISFRGASFLSTWLVWERTSHGARQQRPHTTRTTSQRFSLGHFVRPLTLSYSRGLNEHHHHQRNQL